MTTKSDSPAEASATSPEAMLKAAVSGGKAAERAKAPAPIVARTGGRIGNLTFGLTVGGLVLGTLLGAGGAILVMPRSDDSRVALAAVDAGLEANRLEASRIAIASDRLDKSIAVLREAVDAAHDEDRIRSAGLSEKVGKVETALLAKITALGDRVEQSEKDQDVRIATLSAQADKTQVVNVALPPPAKTDPIQTGSVTEAKPKTSIVETWAVRDVYDGTAMLEDRRRRLIEVVAGDTIPGVGRVEGIERRGREWVVVTRQGIVTAQIW